MLKPTIDHQEIRRWAELCDAHPAEVLPHKFDSEPAILTFLFGDPEVAQTELRAISWESFFAQFDLLKLIFVPEVGQRFQLMRADERTYSRFEGKVVTSS